MTVPSQGACAASTHGSASEVLIMKAREHESLLAGVSLV